MDGNWEISVNVPLAYAIPLWKVYPIDTVACMYCLVCKKKKKERNMENIIVCISFLPFAIKIGTNNTIFLCVQEEKHWRIYKK